MTPMTPLWEVRSEKKNYNRNAILSKKIHVRFFEKGVMGVTKRLFGGVF